MASLLPFLLAAAVTTVGLVLCSLPLGLHTRPPPRAEPIQAFCYGVGCVREPARPLPTIRLFRPGDVPGSQRSSLSLPLTIPFPHSLICPRSRSNFSSHVRWPSTNPSRHDSWLGLEFL